MHIIQVCRRYLPDRGGVETHVAAISAGLEKAGHTISIVTSSQISPEKSKQKLAEKNVWRLPSDTAKKNVWWWVWCHRHLFQQAQIIHVHDVFWWLLPVYPFIFHKVCITFHGWETQWPVRWQAKAHRALASRLCRGRIHIGAWIQKFYWDKPDRVLYGGLDPHVWFGPLKSLSTTPKNICFLGRLSADNDIESYLELFNLLKKRWPHLSLTWIGDGELRPLAEKVGQVTGWLDNPEVLIKKSDIVFANSYLSMLEAQSAGKLVVSFYNFALKQAYLEAYPGQRFLVMSQSAEQAATEIVAAWSDSKKLSERLKAAAAQARLRTWQTVVETYLTLWEEKCHVKAEPVQSHKLPSVTPRFSISVVVTVLNEAKTIVSLLEALKTQTRLPDEVIIVDGGSTDGTLELAQKTLNHKPAPWRYHLLTKPGNRSVGRNHGIAEAKSEWITITDAGCTPHPTWVAELVEATTQLDQNAPAVVAGYYEAAAHTSLEKAIVPYALVMPDRVDPAHFLPATRSMLLNKQAWQLVGGFDERLSDNEDYAMARKLAQSLVSYPQRQMVFAEQAKVTWSPRSNLQSFFWMIFRFARGDMAAGLWRPKVGFIFGRYLGWAALCAWLAQQHRLELAVGLSVVALIGYSWWSIHKNFKYVGSGWKWLPGLQLISDLAVIAGSLAGIGQRLTLLKS